MNSKKETFKKLFKEENYEKMLDAFSLMGEEVYEDLEFLYLRALAHYKLGDYESANIDLNYLVEREIVSPMIYEIRGDCNEKLGNWKLAIQDITSAIKLNENADLFHKRALIFIQTLDFENALRDINDAINIEPNEVDLYLSKGACYEKMDLNTNALLNYNKCIEINPNISVVYYNRSIIYYKMDLVKLAFDDLQFAIKLDPDNIDAIVNRGIIKYLNYSQKEGIIDLLKSAMKGNKNSLEIIEILKRLNPEY
jgi:tetratricopeptide (TPR) repeat protein